MINLFKMIYHIALLASQKVHKDNMVRAGKTYRMLPLHEVDKWIESMGPKVREKRIKIAVDKGAV